MTDAADPPGSSKDFSHSLREAALRVTPQRMVVMEILATADDHPRADDIFSRAREIDETVSLATVYRTLSVLETAGIVRKLTIGDAQARYELTPQSEHDHLVDIDTGEMIEIPNGEIVRLHREIAARLGYDLVSQHTVLRVRRRKD